MLVSFSVGNAFSFNEVQTLHMEAVSARKDDINLNNTHTLTFAGGERLLESALIFGANASGKSNFITCLAILRQVILQSKNILEKEELPAFKVLPFLLSAEKENEPSVMEIVFYENEIRYRYGLEIKQGQVVSEWFFYTPKSRETKLFERSYQEVVINSEGLTEARPFVNGTQILRTRETVPFVSVLASENGEHSLNLVNWFNRLAVISGVYERPYMDFTKKLLEQDVVFKSWLIEILKHFQIYDIAVADGWGEQNSSPAEKQILVVKNVYENGQQTQQGFPLAIESEGTKKLIHLLGPIYDAIKMQRILVIDEFEAKFHSLLSKHIFQIFHSKNTTGAQIIAAVHDTSLMDTGYFRRDQIWLIDKNEQGASELYSLVEFKEKARTLKPHYSEDYLQGAFGAVTLFSSQDELEQVM